MSDVDLLVAGAGGGLVGAVRAAQLGLSVLVVDANEQFLRGNNTSMSTAMVPGAGSRFQREAGVQDSPEQFAADVQRKTGGTANPTVTQALTQVSGRLVEWMADDLGLPMELVTDFEYPGHSRHRCHTVPGRHGSTMLSMLRKAGTSRGIDVQAPMRLLEVRRDGEHVVNRVEMPDGSVDELVSRAVLLATNGFGAAPDLVSQYVPEIAGAVYHGSETSRGDGLRIGQSLGAAVDCMDAYQGHGALAVRAGTLVGWATVMHGGFVVNVEGRRFADETQGYSEFAALELQQPQARSFIVFDQRVYDACLAFEDFRQTVDQGVVRSASSVDGLADRIGVPAGALADSLQQSRDGVGGAPDPFGRVHWGPAPLDGTLYAVEVQPALFHTQGGLVVDRDARVLDGAGQAIEGVYAAGGAAVGMSGRGAGGYLAGNGLLSALGLSLLAAEDAARRLGEQDSGS